jgi:hypothetical protein
VCFVGEATPARSVDLLAYTGGMSSFPVKTVRDLSIRLGQFIKLASLVETGGEAKEMISTGHVMVNGRVETRRGRMLYYGDVVTIGSVGVEVGGPEDGYSDEAVANDNFAPEKRRNM